MAVRAKKRPRKRNPNDATFRNVTALKRRVKALEVRVEALADLLRRLTTADPPFGDGDG